MRAELRVLGLACLACLAALAATGLIACGDEEEVEIGGEGYSFEAPEGWEEISDEAIANVVAEEGIPVPGAGSIEGGAVNLDSGENINVVIPGGGSAILETIDERTAEQFGQRYTQFGEATLPPGVSIAGQPEVVASTLDGEPVFEATVGLQGVAEGPSQIKQLLGLHGGAAYVITITAETTEAAEGYLGELSASWQWS